jgi:hypothetical protein
MSAESRYDEARHDFVEASMDALDKYIDVISKKMSVKTSSDKVKVFIEAKIESIEGALETISFIYDDVPDIMEVLERLKESLWYAHKMIIGFLKDDIEEDLNEGKIKISIQGKRKAFENSSKIIDAIKKVDEMLKSPEKHLSKESTKNKFIEKRAKSI